MSDLLDRTARQVRLPGGTVHQLAAVDTTPDGRRYRTVCDRTLNAAAGALLTPVPVGCLSCHGVPEPAQRLREFVAAVLGDSAASGGEASDG